MRYLSALILAILLTASASRGHAQPQPPCSALLNARLDPAGDVQAQLTSATWRPAGKRVAACHVDGRVDTVRFEIWLPADWNGRLARVDAQFAHLGCTGSDCGQPMAMEACEGVLGRGYACLTSDYGAQIKPLDTAWLRHNPQGAVDLAFRASHLATLAGKAVVRARYGRASDRAYFLGCSQGGRQGLIEAEKFPADYDGIVAGAPLLDPIGNDMALLWNISAMLGADGRSLFPAPNGGYLQPDLRLVHQAVLEQCDLQDGVKDGIVGDPRSCHFDPEVLRCSGAKTSACLSGDQVAAIGKVLAGPRDSHGRPLYPPALPGSEANWGYSYLSPGDDGLARRRMLQTLLQDYALSGAPDPVPAAIDWDALPDRLAVQRAFYDAGHADLSAFKARGGKLILYHGWTDHEALPEATTRFVDGVRRSMGPAAADDFLRLFMIPGMDHCGNGVAADKIDYLRALDEWVRKGAAPDRLLAAKVRDLRAWPADPDYWTPPTADPATVLFTRPVYPYPAQARYRGGDPAQASSFEAGSPAPAPLAAAAAPGGSAFRDCAVDCPLMVPIPAGSFMMGERDGDDSREHVQGDKTSRGGPRHKASVPAFAMGATHVTRAEFAAFIRETGYPMPDSCYVLRRNAPSNGSFAPGEDSNHWGMVLEKGRDWRDPGFAQTERDPVACVSWNDAQAYAAWLSKKTGRHYRLPTDTEWEYAARAGSETVRFWGDDRKSACLYANVSDDSLLRGLRVPASADNTFGCTDGYVFTAPAGSFRPNAFGLYDMIGNLWEYTQDCWNETTNDISRVPVDGSAWVSANCPRRVERGGAWGFNAWNTSSVYRNHNFPISHAATIGFRVARSN